MPRGHIPERTCVACRSQRPKREMVRVVRAPDGAVSVDPTGKKSGRGAYLCSQAECWQTALKRRALDRALKTELSVADREALAAFGVAHATVTGAGESQERGISCPDHSAEAAAGPADDQPGVTAADRETMVGGDQGATDSTSRAGAE